MADVQQSAAPEAAAETIEADDFSALLQKEFKPTSDGVKDAVESAAKPRIA